MRKSLFENAIRSNQVVARESAAHQDLNSHHTCGYERSE